MGRPKTGSPSASKEAIPIRIAVSESSSTHHAKIPQCSLPAIVALAMRFFLVASLTKKIAIKNDSRNLSSGTSLLFMTSRSASLRVNIRIFSGTIGVTLHSRKVLPYLFSFVCICHMVDVLIIGAFAFFGPGQFSTLYTNFSHAAAYGRLHFAGEALSVRHA